MSDVALHRADEAKWIERQPFFSKDLRTLTPAQREHVDIWGGIMSERAEMLPPRKTRKEGPDQRRYGIAI